MHILKCERFLLIGMFDDGFPLVGFLNRLFHTKLREVDHELFEAIKTSGMPDEVWLNKWFMSVFSGYFPTYFASRVLD